MKRFHVHVAVSNLDESVRFYSNLFGSGPTVRKPDYAKWMVEDPRINFAISARSAQTGVNHLGLQVDSDEELAGMRQQLAAADAGLVEEMGANCCYAQSDKYWVTDPQGIAWETYRSLGSIPVFGGHPSADAEDEANNQDAAAEKAVVASACCAPTPATVSAKIPVKAQGTCCS